MTTEPGNLVFDPTRVRKGTRVWASTPTLPANLIFTHIGGYWPQRANKYPAPTL